MKEVIEHVKPFFGKREREWLDDILTEHEKRVQRESVFKTKSTQQWEELVKHRQVYSRTEQFIHLCHCTSPAEKASIEKEGKLLGDTSWNPIDAPLWRADAINVKRVWLMAIQYRGGLQTISPYGSERVRYPVSKLVDVSPTTSEWKLFFESTYYYNRKTQYVRVVLAREPQTDPTGQMSQAFQWCKENLHEVDFSDNPILCCPSGSSTFKVFKNEGIIGSTILVEVLLLGDISLDRECSWDRVEHKKNRCDRQPTMGNTPKLNMFK